MKTIGIRVMPSAITFVVYDSKDEVIVNNERIKIPKALSTPDALKYVRNNILDVLHEYEIENAGLRKTESNSQHLNITRVEIEGVIQEAFASSNLKKYFCGQISNISAKIGIERAKFKKYVNGSLPFNLIENWEEMDEMAREAALAALGAVHA